MPALVWIIRWLWAMKAALALYVLQNGLRIDATEADSECRPLCAARVWPKHINWVQSYLMKKQTPSNKKVPRFKSQWIIRRAFSDERPALNSRLTQLSIIIAGKAKGLFMNRSEPSIANHQSHSFLCYVHKMSALSEPVAVAVAERRQSRSISTTILSASLRCYHCLSPQVSSSLQYSAHYSKAYH